MSKGKRKNTNDDGFQRCREYTPWQISSGWYEDKVDDANLMLLTGVIGVTYFICSVLFCFFPILLGDMHNSHKVVALLTFLQNGKAQMVRAFEKFFDKEAWRRFYQDFWGEKANTSHNNQSNFKETPPKGPNYLRSQHYTVLGLSGTRTLAYTDDEIKRAFRAKAKEVHPDQNPHYTKAAEKFKTPMRSYEALLSERKSKK